VAPEVSLIATKCSAQLEGGSDSNVIAASSAAGIRMATATTSDHADVANLSLGGDGSPTIRSVAGPTTLRLAGVTFVIAAGNSGHLYGIASPGTARQPRSRRASISSTTSPASSSQRPEHEEHRHQAGRRRSRFGILSSFPGNVMWGERDVDGQSARAGAAALLRRAPRLDAGADQAAADEQLAFRRATHATGAGRLDVFGGSNEQHSHRSAVAGASGLHRSSESNWTAAGRCI